MEKANREKDSPVSDKAQAGSSEDPPADVGTALLDELAAIRLRREILGQDNDDTPPDGSLRAASVSEKLAAYYRAVHALEDLSALCLSGGGIRSATFALGVIQALAARGLLKQFDYLSTVSGGGYLGSLLTAWVQREGYDAVCAELTGTPRTANSMSPLQHIRRYSNYLTPRTGLASTDTLMLVALFARNLFLNWLIILPTIVLCILGVKFTAAVAWKWPASPVAVAVFGVATILFVGLALVDSLRQRPGWEEQKSTSSKFLTKELLPMLLGGMALSLTSIQYLT